jgi:hypothetical protein
VVKAPCVGADGEEMTRLLGLVTLLAALVFAGYLVRAQMSATGPTGKTGSRAIAEAGDAVDALNLQQAATALEQVRAGSGTYVGAQLDGLGVVLRRADASSYCLETARAPAAHLAGPGGTPSPGGC